MIKELREDYQNCFNNSALSSTAKRFSPTTLQVDLTTALMEKTVQSYDSPLSVPSLLNHLIRPLKRVGSLLLFFWVPISVPPCTVL
jgi:hypothetical protein